MLSRGEDRRWEASAHVVMHVEHSLVRVEIVAVNHGLVNGLAWRVHVVMVAVMVMMACAAQLHVMRMLSVWSCTVALMVASL